jgi:hypothetical protein
MMKKESNIPGVEKSNRKEEENQKVEQENQKNRFYISALNPEVLKGQKFLYELIEVLRRDIELLGQRQRGLEEVVEGILEIISEKKEKDKEVKDEEPEEDKKSIEEKLKEHVEKELQKTSLFQSPDQRVR